MEVNKTYKCTPWSAKQPKPNLRFKRKALSVVGPGRNSGF